MKIIEFFESTDQAHWIDEIRKGDWRAAAFLAELLEKNTFFEALGENGMLFILTDGENAVSFATLSPRDCIDDDQLTPWIGFVYTFPTYRGHRYSGTVISHALAEAKKQGAEKVYICTDEVGLYEKYGFVYLEDRTDIYGELSRLYYKEI